MKAYKVDLFDLLLLVAVVITTLFLTATVFWGLNRGFDLTDEGYYLVLASNPAKYAGVSAFHFLLSKLPNLTTSKLIDLRIFQLLGQIVSCLLLSYGFWQMNWSNSFRPTKTQLAISVFFTVLASFLLQAIFPPSLSYNGLTYFLIFSSFGLLFAAAGVPSGKANLPVLLSCISGFLCVFELPVKFTAGVLSVFLGFAWLCINKNQRSLLTSYSLGLFAGAVFFLCVIQTPLQFQEQLEQIRCYATMTTTHSPGAILRTNLLNIKTTLETGWVNFGFVLLVPALSATLAILAAKSKLPAKKYVIGLLASACLLPSLFLISTKNGAYYLSYVDVQISVSLGMSVLLIFALTRYTHGFRLISHHLQFLSSLAILFVLPLVCSFGSANPLPFQLVSCMSPVFLALSAISLKVLTGAVAAPFRFALIGGLTSLVITVFLNGYIHHPYLLYGSLEEQRYDASDLPNLRGVKLSKDSLNFLSSTYEILTQNGYQPGDPIMSLFDIPGAVYALGGTEVGSPWLLSLASFKDFRPRWYRSCRKDVTDKLFVLNSWELSAQTRKSLLEAGFDFPSDFELVGMTDMKPYSYGLQSSGTGDRYLVGKVRLYRWRGSR